MLTYDPDDRITSKEALRHSFFKDILAEEALAREKAVAVTAPVEKLSIESGSKGVAVRFCVFIEILGICPC